MRYCKKCVQPDTRPGIVFNEEQICYACLYEEEKNKIDWSEREKELAFIVDEAKKEARKRNSAYDCVIGVSGGKDSTFQAVWAKEKLGLHPLLINSMPDKLTEIGRYNLNNLSNLGFDIIHLRANPQVERSLMHRGFIEFGNIYKYSEQSLWASTYKMAEKLDVPLIIQGENPALTLGVCLKMDTSGDAFNVVNLDTLSSGSVTDLPEVEFPPRELWMYTMPSPDGLKQKNIKAIWLQYYVKRWSQVGNADFSIARGLRGRTAEDLHDLGRYRRYTGLDSDFIMVNQMLKYFKFGFGFATDEACYDIREGRLTRDEALWYVKEYDGKCGEQYIDAFCKYVEITKEEFWNKVDSLVNKSLFAKDASGKWQPMFGVGVDSL